MKLTCIEKGHLVILRDRDVRRSGACLDAALLRAQPEHCLIPCPICLSWLNRKVPLAAWRAP